jgi:gas vesicle protein
MSKLFIGFAAGLLVGVLFAPDKGSETRERIARRGRDLKDKFSDLVDSISSKFDDMTDSAADIVDKSWQRSRTENSQAGSTWAG